MPRLRNPFVAPRRSADRRVVAPRLHPPTPQGRPVRLISPQGKPSPSGAIATAPSPRSPCRSHRADAIAPGSLPPRPPRTQPPLCNLLHGNPSFSRGGLLPPFSLGFASHPLLSRPQRRNLCARQAQHPFPKQRHSHFPASHAAEVVVLLGVASVSTCIPWVTIVPPPGPRPFPCLAIPAAADADFLVVVLVLTCLPCPDHRPPT